MALWKKNEVTVDITNYRHYWRAPKKWGKTTLFANLIKELYGDMSHGLLISCGNERGYLALDNLMVADCPDWSTLMEVVDELVENKGENSFSIIAFDTVDEWISMAQKEIVRLDYKKSGTKHEFNACFGGYGAGRRKVDELINSVITRLESSGYCLVFIGHTKIKDIKEKNGDEYQMLTSNLSTDYDSIFANKADICMMGVIEREITDGHVDGVSRWMYFRGNGYIDAGGRFEDIADRVEVSAKNYIDTVKDAIKNSIKSHDATDEYIESKSKQEKKEKEDYYNSHKEDLMETDELDVEIRKDEECKNLKAEIKGVLSSLSPEDKKAKRAALKEAGLPDQFAKVTDIAILNQILEVVSQ